MTKIDLTKLDAFEPEKTSRRGDSTLTAFAALVSLHRSDWNGEAIAAFARQNGFPAAKAAYCSVAANTARALFAALLTDPAPVEWGGHTYVLTRSEPQSEPQAELRKPPMDTKAAAKAA